MKKQAKWEKLKDAIEIICDNEDRNNTVSFYMQVMSCINECLNLVDLSQISSSEKEILERGRKIWNSNLYNSNELYELYCVISQKCNSIDSTTKEYYVLQAISYLLMPYNKWPDDERANALEYFIEDVIRSGACIENIYSIITKHFGNITNAEAKMKSVKADGDMENQFNKALRLLDVGKTDKAIDLLNEVVAEGSNKSNNLFYIRANCVLGELLFSNGKENEAKRYLTEVMNAVYENDLVDYEKSVASEILSQIK